MRTSSSSTISVGAPTNQSLGNSDVSSESSCSFSVVVIIITILHFEDRFVSSTILQENRIGKREPVRRKPQTSCAASRTSLSPGAKNLTTLRKKATKTAGPSLPTPQHG